MATDVKTFTDDCSDDELVARIRGGDRSAYAVLMRRHNARLFRVARSILRDDDEAEDVMQQAYVNAFLHLDQFLGRARFGTWLTRIAAHEALARAKRRGRWVEMETMTESNEAVLTAPGPDPEQQAASAEVRRLLEASLGAIPDSYRAVFVLREVEGLSTAETADLLQLGEEAVKTRLFRARALLKDELWQRAGIASASVFPLHLTRCDAVIEGVLARLPRSV